MKQLPALISLMVAVFLAPAQAQTIAGDAAVQAQWFTGTLEAPSPALPAAGILAVEPYAIYTSNNGAYDNSGGHHSLAATNLISSVTAIKYAVTDRISIQALPSFSHLLSGNDNYTGPGDLPVEAEYRFNDENNKTGYPSVTASLGVTLPIGDYQRLSGPSEGFGAGVYSLKEGILFQSLFDTSGGHPMRFRFYGSVYEPLSSADVHDISVYGTSRGFSGQAMPGNSAVLGIGGGYAFTQQWVLALDLVQNFGNGLHLQGAGASGVATNSHGESSAELAMAPAIEYNFSDTTGIIAGVELSVAGRNTSSYFAPQIALSTSF